MSYLLRNRNISREKEFKRRKTIKPYFKVFLIQSIAIMTLLFSAGFLQAAENRSNVYDTRIRLSLQNQKDFGNLNNAYRNLDRMLERIKTEIQPQSSFNKTKALKALSTIGRILREEENFWYSKNVLLVVELNKDKQSEKYLDCDDYSSIYLAAAEHINLSLKPVYFPDHVFLKCETDNGRYFYWEPTEEKESTINMYRKWKGVSFSNRFPIVLDEIQLEAIQLSDLGVAWFYRKNYEKATEYFQKSLEANSEFGTAYNNLGASLARQGNIEDALESYQIAIDKNPNNSTAFLNTGVAYYKLGNFRKSIKFFDASLKLNPMSYNANLYKYRVLVAKGNPRKAVRFLHQLRKLLQ